MVRTVIVRSAGFVLAGGRSSRMGRDKAVLPWKGSTLLESAAVKVREAAGSVTILGDRERYGHFGFPVLADVFPDCGPLGGLHAALRVTDAEWNLLVACDMPAITADLLTLLLAEAVPRGGDAVVPRVGDRWEPLCAVYHRRLAAAAETALKAKVFKMQEFVSQIDAHPFAVPDPAIFANWNTPKEVRAS